MKRRIYLLCTVLIAGLLAAFIISIGMHGAAAYAEKDSEVLSPIIKENVNDYIDAVVEYKKTMLADISADIDVEINDDECSAVVTLSCGEAVSYYDVTLDGMPLSVENNKVFVDDLQYDTDYEIVATPVFTVCGDVETVGASSSETVVIDTPVSILCNRSVGSDGRLVVPDLGINVALYPISFSSADGGQSVVDAYDSCGMYHVTGFVLADHWNQGFSAIAYAVPGETVAYIGDGCGNVRRYVCSSVTTGTNTGNELYDSSGRNLKYINSGGLTMYTCNGSWQNIVIAFWVPL